ncbi:MAG: shikimate kinase, partial [Alphaproteobacteria bacterium]
MRQARAERSLSRRALAERSGVSERYLATLETGAGNVSIGVLERVAEALQLGIERLVAPEDPLREETDRLIALYRRATAVQRRQALAALEPEPEGRPVRDARVCLIGLRGAGKSTLGPLVAADLNIPFVELADVIEKLSGLPVPEVLALYGQAGYREAERRALQAVAEAHDRVVLAVAGGIVES